MFLPFSFGRGPVVENEVVFVVHDSNGSAILRGHQVSASLREQGIPSQCVRHLPNCKNCIIVFVKFFPYEKALKAKEGGNSVIVDAIDVHQATCLRGWKSGRLFANEILPTDGLILQNALMLGQSRSQYPAIEHQAVIYHHWDPRCRIVERPDRFSLIHVGFSGVPWQIPSLDDFKVGGLFGHHRLTQSDFDAIGQYTCHLDVRDPTGKHDRERTGDSSIRAASKSCIKTATASAFGANIIASDYPAAFELLGNDYPFLLKKSDRESVLDACRTARESYGSDLWKNGLKRMQEIRERLALPRITQDYMTFFRTFGLKWLS